MTQEVCVCVHLHHQILYFYATRDMQTCKLTQAETHVMYMCIYTLVLNYRLNMHSKINTQTHRATVHPHTDTHAQRE